MFRKMEEWFEVLAIFSASITSIASGSVFAILSPAIPKLLTDYRFTIDEVSYLAVIPPVAMTITTPIFCWLADKVGRKYTLLTTGICYILCSLLMAVSHNIYVFYLSRAFYGAGDAAIFASLPAYIAEVTTPKVRGLYGNALAVSSFLGQFLANCIGFYLTVEHAAYVLLLFPILFMINFSLMPESPYYLIMKGDMNSATKSLQKLRRRQDVTEEVTQITVDVHRQLSESGRFKDLWLIKSNRKALFTANTVRLFNQFSGFSAIVVYGQYIFQEAGGDISSGASGMIVSGIFAFSMAWGNLISDKLGRKMSMILSCGGCAITLLGEAVYFYLQIYEIVNVKAISWFPVVGIAIYAVAFSIGLGVVPSLLLGEIFSASIRKHATTIANMAFGIYVCTLSKFFQVMMSSYGLWVPFLFFGITSLLSSILSYVIVPETKGKTLEEIQQMLKGNKR